MTDFPVDDCTDLAHSTYIVCKWGGGNTQPQEWRWSKTIPVDGSLHLEQIKHAHDSEPSE